MKGYFNKESAALVEKEKRAQVNYEFFYFADEAGKEQFESDPLRWCGTVTDPISRERFRPTEKSAVAEHNGIPFFFSSEDTKTAFAAHPDSFSVMHQKMFEMDAD